MADIHELGAHENMTVRDCLELSARQAELFQRVMVIGWGDDGELMIRSSHMGKAEACWLLDAAKYWALFGDERMKIEPKAENADG